MKNLWHIDDNADDRYLVGTLLRSLEDDLDITGFAYGREALDALHIQSEKRSDLLLLDLNMPDMGGLDFLQELGRMDRSEVNVVVLTSSDSEKERRQAKLLGAKDVVQKPFDLLAYKTLLSEVLEEYG